MQGGFMPNKLLRFLLVMMLFLGTANFCSADDLSLFDGQKGTIKIAGGTAHIPVMQEAAKRIMTKFPDISITVAGGGSGVGIQQVGEGLVDIGNSGREPTPEEIQKYGLKMFKWAIDGVGIIINPANTIKNIGRDQLKDIYSGKIDNWSALGGMDHAITLYTRDESSGTREVFWEKALGKGDISAKALFVESNGAMKTAVAKDPYAIGYVSVGHIDNSVQPVPLDGVSPTLESVKNGTYKVARGLYSNTRGEPTGLTKQFIDYLFTADGQHIASEKGFISVK
jgi:phosphate transport system substrate-binding protein